MARTEASTANFYFRSKDSKALVCDTQSDLLSPQGVRRSPGSETNQSESSVLCPLLHNPNTHGKQATMDQLRSDWKPASPQLQKSRMVRSESGQTKKVVIWSIVELWSLEHFRYNTSLNRMKEKNLQLQPTNPFTWQDPEKMCSSMFVSNIILLF